ncbi:hypothetical protein DAI22_01g058200 [Oryza sativa Japonica Group]|nr:hypothetical protein DAI22_01g058200 [Oryza sativa Japonica Group]
MNITEIPKKKTTRQILGSQQFSFLYLSKLGLLGIFYCTLIQERPKLLKHILVIETDSISCHVQHV